MTTPTAGELALLRTQPQQTKLYLSIYEPQIVFQAQVNDAGAAKGDRVITYDSVTYGNYLSIGNGMTMYVGTSAGAKDKGSIYVYKHDSSTITVGENSHINWADDDYLTIVNFHQIWPVYPRYVQDAEDITVYKFYDQYYISQNEDLGSFVVMGSNYAGFIDPSTGTAQVYWDASESENVYGTTGSTYQWSFEGGTPTGSTAITPGWVTYDTPGHYRVLCNITTPVGGFTDFGKRHVSIYDRPGYGDNTPILRWGMDEFTGSRDEGGYTARLWVKEDVSSVVDGALVIIFSDDWYGDTQQSIGGNSAQRENIFFVGYIIGESIDYDYKTSTVRFDVGSPTEIMKIGETFSVSVEDSDDPVGDAAAKGGDPWFYLKGLSVKTALYHYYHWHSVAQFLMDMRYVGDDFDIQFFDADRTSLYDAGSTFLKSTVFGEMSCDRQGAVYFEIGAEATDSAASSFNQSMFIDNHDWMGTPSIREKVTNEISYIEAGGVAYTNYKNAGDGSFTALLAAGPGETPAYRGKNQKISGLALTSQNQLNTLVGNVYENRNATYPEVTLDLVGNFRNLDIAPQEIVTMTLNAADTFRGISWEQKAFTPRVMSWNYNPEKGLLLPSITLNEITQGNAGETISIPVTPPSGGYEQPPIPLPPPVPPIPSLPSLGGAGVYWIPIWAGYNDTTLATIDWERNPGVPLNTTQICRVMGQINVPIGVSSVYVYLVGDSTDGGDGDIVFSGSISSFDSDGNFVSGDTLPNTLFSSPLGGDSLAFIDTTLTLSLTNESIIQILIYRQGSNGSDTYIYDWFANGFWVIFT
ncbi:MAG: hypothetical protein BV458_12075 [Thermoplasmata archaeon M9B2D]|nr:MAG: hypothetical protein BV458_12075 [Thermoplasmata archaeon M9B2D]